MGRNRRRRKKKKPAAAVRVEFAQASDMAAMIAMGEKAYFAAKQNERFGDYSPENIEVVIRNIMASDDHAIFVARNGGPEPIGFLPVVMYPVPIAVDKKLAQDICIWVDENHRKTGAGPAMVSAAADWAKERGASCFILSSPNGCGEIADLCIKRGFRLLESNYARVF